MIRQVEQYHGAALARLIRHHTRVPIAIRAFEEGRSGYVLDQSVGLYIKYSTNRLSPWSFNFTDGHQREVAVLAGECPAGVFIALVCGEDGIACLSISEYHTLLDDDFEPVEWIKAVRGAREKYRLSGSDSRRPFKVGDNEYPGKVYVALHPDEAEPLWQ